MRSFSDYSIRRKLQIISMTTSATALILACGTLGAYEYMAYRQALVRNLEVLTRVVGNNCSAALTFSDARAATDVLGALRLEKAVLGATLYNSRGEVFASFPEGAPPQNA